MFVSVSYTHLDVYKRQAQNSEIYFQTREASNKFYNNIIPVVEEYMGKMSELTGRNYEMCIRDRNRCIGRTDGYRNG